MLAVLRIASLFFVFVSSALAEPVFQELYEFFGTNSGPMFARAGLIEGKDGILYGVSRSRGDAPGYGTIFKITKSGQLTTLHSFDWTDGLYSYGLTSAPDGGFYGTTFGFSGLANVYGTIFKLTTNNVLMTLGYFSSTNGIQPGGPLTFASDGNMYGCNGYNMIFRVSTNGTPTAVFSFNGTNGSFPYGRLLPMPDGQLYGTTFNGGVSNRGTAFRVTTNGVLTTLVWFDVTNGMNPSGGLIRGNDDSLYGMTSRGGNSDRGTVFKLTTNGLFETVLHFDGTNGAGPYGTLGIGRDGAFYGATGWVVQNSISTNGTLFKLTMNGTLTTLVHFNGTNAAHPFTEIISASDGNLYGIAADLDVQATANGNSGLFFRLLESPDINSFTFLNGDVRLNWNSYTGGVYRVEHTASLTSPSWTVLASNLIATGFTMSFTNPSGGATQGFYRAGLNP